MSRRRGKAEEAVAGISPTYEGPEVLGALLARAGSPTSIEEVVERFAKAQAAGEARGEVIPTLFPDEPRFASPDDARRLYANLFGLWARLAAGLGAQDDAPALVPEPEAAAAAAPPVPPLPERGTARGELLEPDLVEAVWQNLAAAPAREVQRRRDRFMNVQPDVIAWLESVPLPESGGLAAQDLAFEAWAMFDQAFGDRLGTVAYGDLVELEKEPPPVESVQPALAAYTTEQLDVLADEDKAFGPEERAQVERVVAAVAAAFTAALKEEVQA